MATRNRTALYRKHRDACKSVRAPLSSSASGSGGPVIEMVSGSLLRSNRSAYAPLSTEDPGPSSEDAFAVGLPPAWVDDFEEIAVNVQRVKTKMAELAKAHSKALMPTFGDGKEDQRTIEALTQEITDLLRRSEKRLRNLSISGPSEDSNIRKNVQRSLATDLQSLSMELRRKQSTYLKRLQQQKEEGEGVDLEMKFNENNSRLDHEFTNVGFNDHQVIKLKRSEQLSAEREREIKLAMESVNELAQIMKDLSVLVIDQGTIVDRIDHNIQDVAASAKPQCQSTTLLVASLERTQAGIAMLIPRSRLLCKTVHLRFFSQSATAALVEDPASDPLTYLDGFPRPDPKFAETILAVPRSASGKSIAAKERKAGRVPSIVFEQEDGQHGGNKRLISVQTNQIRKLVNHLGRSFFLSRLFDLEVRPELGSDEIVEKVRVLPRMLHLHAGTDAPLNVTFIRAPSHALLKVDIPLVFRGEDVSPGLRKGAYLNTIKRTVKYLCPGDIIPPYIDVDLSDMDVGQKLVMGDLKVHPALKLIRSKDEPVCKIMGARVSDQQKKK